MISISPWSGVIAPSSMSSVVVLPAPLGPSNPTRSPACTVRSTPSTACTSLNRLRSPRASSTAPMDFASLAEPMMNIVGNTPWLLLTR